MMEKQFLKRYIILGSLLIVATVVVFSFCLDSYSSTAMVLTPLIFTLISIINIKVMSNPKLSALLKFNNAFLLTNALKLILYLVYFVACYIVLTPLQRMPFVIYFLANYVIYAIVDTLTLLQIFKNNDNQTKENK